MLPPIPQSLVPVTAQQDVVKPRPDIPPVTPMQESAQESAVGLDKRHPQEAEELLREEQRRQKGTRPKQQTLIGSLIQDAIMSFRSLTEDDTSASAPSPDERSGVGAIPLSFGTFEGSSPGSRAPSSEP